MPRMTLRRVLPDPTADLPVDEAYAQPLGTGTPDRPWVQVCMVSSLDGSTVVDGVSGGLSSPNDLAVLLQLRSLADVILVGAGTAAGEGYGPPGTPGQRIGLVTRSGNIDTTTPLFRSGAAFVVTTEQTEVPGVPDGPDLVRVGATEVDLTAAVTEIGRRFHASVIQAEGGPMLNGALTAADLIDELDLTSSPAIVAGDGPRLTRRGPDVTQAFDLAQLAVDDQQFLFQRWRRRR